MARSRTKGTSSRVGLLLMIALSVGLLFYTREGALDRRTTPLLASDIQAPIAAWLSRPLRSVEARFADIENSRQALEENRALREELEALRSRNARLEAQNERLRRLETHLGVRLPGDIPDSRISVRAVSDPSSPFVRSLLIGTGREHGVRDGYPVLSEAGLVGHVVSAGKRSARVLRLDDLNSRVAVKSVRSGSRAILAGNNAENPVLSFVSEADDWQAGDRIVTSGDDGRLPQGLPVGTLLSDETLSVQADFNGRPVDWVFVLPFDGLADADDVDAPETETATEEGGDTGANSDPGATSDAEPTAGEGT